MFAAATLIVSANARHRPPAPWALPRRGGVQRSATTLQDYYHELLENARGGGGDYDDGGGGADWYEQAARKDRDRRRYYSREHDDDYYGDDYGTSSSPMRPSSNNIPSVSKVLNVIQNGDRQVGFILLGSGAVITMLGISLFFNKALLRLGNLLFMAGVPITIGPSRTMGYFVRPEKLRATVCLALGIVLVLMGSPIFGMILEVFGLLNLFGNMFPFVWAIAKNLPVVGPILKSTSGEGGSSPRRKQRDSYNDDNSGQYYYDEDDGYYGSGDQQQGGGDYSNDEYSSWRDQGPGSYY